MKHEFSHASKGTINLPIFIINRSPIGTRNYSSPPQPPPGPPSDPSPTPPLEPPGVRTPVESLPPPQKTHDSITFPWLHGNQLPRIINYPYLISNSRKSLTSQILSLLPVFLQHKISMWVTAKMLKGATSSSYFPDEFLAGASYAIRQVCAAFSTPSDLEALKQMFTPKLYDHFVTELEKISSEKSSITIEISKIYNAKIHDIWVNVGPQKATQKRLSDDKEIQKNYLIIHWMTIRIGIQRGDEKESYTERKAKVSKAFSDGIGFKVDVNFDADIIYSLKSSENQQLIYDQVRRPLIVRFESPYFEPSNKIFKKITSNETGSGDINEEEDSVMNWNWQVGDIDYLLEKEDLESEEKLET
ncbi:hypothetical protein Glove_208g22 [Diversispora epigaea]|uniref:Tim44-like domain-containing protein n=1 Tax=Diversispora epigaea TaxID=1348612 RepID=A0A397ITM8_9GLOM|nr:hypothetical protein Glove_208g22 [Diversispora epigaea]